MKKNKGFTLVELLAVIIIVGVLSVISIVTVSRLIDKSRDTQLTQQKNTLSMAAESYLQSNRVFLPKSIGQTIVLQASTLKEAGYLKTNIKNSKGEDCMSNSMVKVTKKSKNKYDYVAYLYCGNDKVPTSEKVDEPIIKIDFVDENGKTTDENPEILKNVSTARFRISYKGNSQKDLAIVGYSYSILIATGESDKLQEAYNSGTLTANGSYEIQVNKLLKEYVDITTATTIKIKATAINEAGGIKDDTSTFGEPSKSAQYNDDVPPTCDSSKGAQNEATANKWMNKKSVEEKNSRKITVYCTDGKGSGCVRDEFTRTWPNNQQKSAIYGYIQVQDNAGNTNVKDEVLNSDICNTKYDLNDPCLVKVFVDTVAPIIEVDAVSNKNTSRSVLKSDAVKTTANSKNDSATITAAQYENLTNGWGNAANYKGGIKYKITIKDDIHIASWKWETNKYNSSGYSDNNPDAVKEKTITKDSKALCGTRNLDIEVGFTDKGSRKGRLTVKDIAGNVTTYYLEFNLDDVNPTCNSSGGNPNWTNKDITLLGKCDDDITHGGSGCTGNVTNQFTKNTNLTNQSPGTVSDKAGNSVRCPGTETVKIDKDKPVCASWNDASFKDNWVKGSRKIILTGSDSGGSGWASESTKSWSYSSGTVKTKDVSYTLKDKAGNETVCKKTVNVFIDNDAPKCGTATNASTSWINTSRTIKQACVVTNGSPCKKSSYDKTYSTTTKTDKVTISDTAGNTAECKYNVYVDTTAPVCGKVTNGSTQWTNASRNISVACSDGTNQSNCTKSSFSYNFTTSYKTSYITIKDKAGNTKRCDVNVYVDKDKPKCTGVTAKAGSTNYSSGTLTCSNVTVTGTCSDTGGSGCNANPSQTVTAKGSTKVTLKVTDKAGNEGTCSTVTVKKGTNSASSACTCKTYYQVKSGCSSWGSWIDKICYGTGSNCISNKPSNSYDYQYKCQTTHGCNQMLKRRTCTKYAYTDGSTCKEYNTCCHE